MTISAKETPKNHIDKERLATASSCIETGILALLFPRKRRRSTPSSLLRYRVLEAVASRILKTLIKMGNFKTREQNKTLMLHINIACFKAQKNSDIFFTLFC